MELVGITDPIEKEGDDVAPEKFCESIKFVNGRYQITFPWKSDRFCLSDNLHVAMKRIKDDYSMIRVYCKLMTV